MDNNENNGFKYTYSAKEQAELKRIRAKYVPQEENKMERLLRLDRGVTKKAQAFAISLGVIGLLVLGLGMSIAISELRITLGLSEDLGMIVGIAVGILGCIIAITAYPAYNAVYEREKNKIAPEILRLTDELMK